MTRKYQPFLSKTEGLTFECLLAVKESPHIIFLNGYRMNLKSWDSVYPKIASEYSVLLYNRLGIGKSSKADRGQAASVVVQDMRKLINSLQLTPPYILVAHSMGGLFADLYARTYNDEVAGVVFVDCPHPEEIIEQRKFKLPVIPRLFNSVLNLIDRLFDRYMHSEDENIERTVSEIQNAGSFPKIPIAIVSGQKKMPFVPKAVFDIHRDYQHKLLSLSPHSKHFLCHKSGHFPQISEPDKVISSILEMATDIKSANKLS